MVFGYFIYVLVESSDELIASILRNGLAVWVLRAWQACQQIHTIDVVEHKSECRRGFASSSSSRSKYAVPRIFHL